MALTTTPAAPRRARAGRGAAPGARGVRVLRGAHVAVGVSVAYLVARDGSPPWQILRLACVVAVTTVIWVLLGRSARGPRAGIAFAAGCLAIPVGAGIAVPHLAKAGLQPVTLAGLITLLGGLVLVGIGAATLVRVTPRWWRAAVVPALLAVVLVPVPVLGQAVAATNVPPTTVGSITPGGRGLAYDDVAFGTSDGVTLSGWYIRSANGAAVALLHGAGSTRSDVLNHAVVLTRHGYGVLLFDARGHGRSGGRAMDFGWYGDQDTGAAVSFLRSRPDVDHERIGVIGLSMGGEEAIGAAATDPRIHAVVAEGATNRVTADRDWMSDESGWRGSIQEGIEWLTYNTADLLTYADPPIALHDAVAAASPRPVLLIAGGAMADEAKAGRYIQSGSPSTVDLWVVPNTGHTAALDTQPQQWEQRVTTFLTAALHPDAA